MIDNRKQWQNDIKEYYSYIFFTRNLMILKRKEIIQKHFQQCYERIK
jgi:hypothetical protein